MASNKYFYIMLKEDFFASDEMTVLQTYSDANELIIMYLKLVLRSLKWGGYLLINDSKPMSKQMLVNILGSDEMFFDYAMGIYDELGMVSIMKDNTFYIPNIDNYIGKSSKEADRQRGYDRQKKSLRNLEENPKKSSDIYNYSNKYIKSESENDNQSEISSFDSLKAWEDTFERYPKKRRPKQANEIWKKKILEVPEEEQKNLAANIYIAILFYLENYKANNPDDATCSFVPRFEDWLINDCDYWISVAKKETLESVTIDDSEEELVGDEWIDC